MRVRRRTLIADPTPRSRCLIAESSSPNPKQRKRRKRKNSSRPVRAVILQNPPQNPLLNLKSQTRRKRSRRKSIRRSKRRKRRNRNTRRRRRKVLILKKKRRRSPNSRFPQFVQRMFLLSLKIVSLCDEVPSSSSHPKRSKGKKNSKMVLRENGKEKKSGRETGIDLW